MKTRSPIALRLAGLAAVAVLASAAAAQSSTVRPPVPASTDTPPLTTYIMAVLVGAIVIGGNLIPSKRGHQD